MIVNLQGLLLIDSFNIIALTETWLDSDFSDSELQLNGYNIVRWENVTQQKKEQTKKIVSTFLANFLPKTFWVVGLGFLTIFL